MNRSTSVSIGLNVGPGQAQSVYGTAEYIGLHALWANKARTCKTFIREFDSHPRLQQFSNNPNSLDTFASFGLRLLSGACFGLFRHYGWPKTGLLVCQRITYTFLKEEEYGQ